MAGVLTSKDIEFLISENKKETTWEVLSNDKKCFVLRNSKETHFTYKGWKRWDKNYLSETVLKTIDKDSDIVYIQYKTPTGISYRDNCLVRLKSQSDKQLILVSKSIENENAPITKDFVRAHTHFYGAIIEQDGENVTMFLYSKQDFGGYIPNFLINMVSKSRPKEWYLDLSNALHKFQKSKL